MSQRALSNPHDRTGPRLAGAILSLGLVLFSAGAALARPAPAGAEAASSTTSPAAREIEAWVRDTGDNQGLPFLIIDKVSARALAFDRDGRLLADAPVLLGLGRGDVSPPGIGERPLSAIGPQDRITPAGRFVASLGENLAGKGILWIDYDAALSLHPVITGKVAERRRQRLETATADDNRISYGCINVPESFFGAVVQPAFSGTTGIVYILPEARSLAEVFPRTVARTDPAGAPVID